MEGKPSADITAPAPTPADRPAEAGGLTAPQPLRTLAIPMNTTNPQTDGASLAKDDLAQVMSPRAVGWQSHAPWLADLEN